MQYLISRQKFQVIWCLFFYLSKSLNAQTQAENLGADCHFSNAGQGIVAPAQIQNNFSPFFTNSIGYPNFSNRTNYPFSYSKTNYNFHDQNTNSWDLSRPNPVAQSNQKIYANRTIAINCEQINSLAIDLKNSNQKLVEDAINKLNQLQGAPL